MRRIVLFALFFWAPLMLAAQVPAALFSGLRWRCTGPEGGPVAVVAGLPGQPGQYTLRTPSGDLFHTTDGGESWNEGGSLPTSAAAQWTDPDNPRRIIRAETEGVSVSLDAGASWTPWHNLDIAQVAHLPGGSTEVGEGKLRFRAAATGVEVSFDAGAQWQPLQLNLPRTEVRALALRGDDLIAATWGRSVWELDDIGPLRQLAADPSVDDATRLFAPAPATAPRAAILDYYLAGDARAQQDEPVRLEVVSLRGEVVYAAASAGPPADLWFAAPPPLSAAGGEHRITWDLRYDPPPSPTQRYHRLAPQLFAGTPAAPPGPLAEPGVYSVRLRVGSRTYTQPLTVGGTASAERFGFEMKIVDAMQIAHDGHRQVAAARGQLQTLLQDADPDIAQAASDLDTALAAVEGADWTGVVLPDEAENEGLEPAEDKDADAEGYTPIAESISKDYDDPTPIIGRSYDNAAVPPSFASAAAAMAGLLTTSEAAEGGAAPTAPSSLEHSSYGENCAQLQTVFGDWKDARTAAEPLNRLLAAAGRPTIELPPAPSAAPVCQ